MQFIGKGHWSQPQQSAIAWTYRGTFYRSISSDQYPAKLNQQQLGLSEPLPHGRPSSDNNIQQLLGVIKAFTQTHSAASSLQF